MGCVRADVEACGVVSNVTVTGRGSGTVTTGNRSSVVDQPRARGTSTWILIYLVQVVVKREICTIPLVTCTRWDIAIKLSSGWREQCYAFTRPGCVSTNLALSLYSHRL